MKKYLVSLLILAAFTPGAARAQNKITEHVIASGGVSNGPAIHTLSAIGQTIAGTTAAGAFQVCAGFECSVASRMSGSATAVFLSFFNATLNEHEVALDWDILSASGLVGFNIYRAESPGGTYAQINDELLRGSDARHFVDRAVEPEHQYAYKLGAQDLDGEFLSEARRITTPKWITELRQNYPNPFNPHTKVSFYLAKRGTVSLQIYDQRGQLVTTLLGEVLEAGNHVVPWEGTDSRHQPVSSGVYYARLLTESRILASKMTLLK